MTTEQCAGAGAGVLALFDCRGAAAGRDKRALSRCRRYCQHGDTADSFSPSQCSGTVVSKLLVSEGELFAIIAVFTAIDYLIGYTHRHTPFPPFSPSLISLMVSVDAKHHIDMKASRNLPNLKDIFVLVRNKFCCRFCFVSKERSKGKLLKILPHSQSEGATVVFN